MQRLVSGLKMSTSICSADNNIKMLVVIVVAHCCCTVCVINEGISTSSSSSRKPKKWMQSFPKCTQWSVEFIIANGLLFAIKTGFVSLSATSHFAIDCAFLSRRRHIMRFNFWFLRCSIFG